MPLTNQHSRKGLVLGSVVLLALGVLAQSTFAEAADKVAVCHRSPGNPSNFRILSVAPSDVADHIAHGDNLVEPEVCDGVDNDCDGVIDNHLGTLGTCTVGQGVCAMTAALVCSHGVQVCTAVAGTPLETKEVSCSDGLDNDCDGATDAADDDCTPGCLADCTAAHQACYARAEVTVGNCLAGCQVGDNECVDLCEGRRAIFREVCDEALVTCNEACR